MKKVIKTVLVAAAAIIAASCSKNPAEVVSVPSSDLVYRTFTASFEATKTAIDGVKTTWVAGDKIALYDSVGVYVFTAKESGATTTFEGEAPATSKNFGAVYPYAEDAAPLNPNKPVINGLFCPGIVTVADGSMLPLGAAFTDTGNLVFSPLAGVVKFTVRPEDADIYQYVEFVDVAGSKAICGTCNINLLTLNMAPTSNGTTPYSRYAPESGKVAAGTYYLGAFVGSNKTERVFDKGIKLNFVTPDGYTAELTGEAFTLKKGCIIDFGTVAPVDPTPVETGYKPYAYPEVKAFKPFANLFVATTKTATNDITLNGNVATFAATDHSIAGSTITWGGAGEHAPTTITFGSNASPLANSYFTSVDWKKDDYIVFATPLPNEISGPVAVAFGLSCGALGQIGTFHIEWSADGTNWTPVEKVYSMENNTEAKAVAAGNLFNANQSKTYNDGYATAVFTPSAPLPAGSTFYFKLTSDQDCASATRTIRLNGGIYVHQFVPDTDFSGDANVIFSENFESCRAFCCDVVGCPISFAFNVPVGTLAKDGYKFAPEGWTTVGDVGRKLGHVMFGQAEEAECALITPALSKLTAPTDIVVSVKVAPVFNPATDSFQIPDFSIKVAEGAGTAEETQWTKPLLTAGYNWTVAYCRISGADATTRIRFGYPSTIGRCEVDDIVVVPAGSAPVPPVGPTENGGNAGNLPQNQW